MPIHIDDRLPPLKVIEGPNRQQQRRVALRFTICSMCRGGLDAADLCFADGDDAHLSCANGWNQEMLSALDTLRAQDEEAILAVAEDRKAMARESRGFDKWTQPTATRGA